MINTSKDSSCVFSLPADVAPGAAPSLTITAAGQVASKIRTADLSPKDLWISPPTPMDVKQLSQPAPSSSRNSQLAYIDSSLKAQWSPHLGSIEELERREMPSPRLRNSYDALYNLGFSIDRTPKVPPVLPVAWSPPPKRTLYEALYDTDFSVDRTPKAPRPPRLRVPYIPVRPSSPPLKNLEAPQAKLHYLIHYQTPSNLSPLVSIGEKYDLDKDLIASITSDWVVCSENEKCEHD